MSGVATNKSGLILIGALGLAIVVVAALIGRSWMSQSPTIESAAPAQTPVAGGEGSAERSSTEPGREPPLLLLTRPETSAPAQVSTPDLMVVQLNNEALVHYSRGEYPEAVELFQKAYERDGRNEIIRSNLASARGSLAWKQLDSRAYQDSLLNFQAAVQLKPGEPSFYLGQGLDYYRMEELDRAIGMLKRTLELDPKNADAYKIIGEIHYKQNEIEMAAGYYEKALELDPSDQALRQHLAKVRREEKVETGFQQQASLSFTIKFEGRDERESSRRILRDLEDAYHEIGQALSYYPREPVTVILYTNQQFQDVTRSASWATGIFDGKIRVPIDGAERNPELLRRVLFHEYTHAVVHSLSRGAPVPTWLNEGVAVYFEDGERSSREQTLVRQLRTGIPIVPLSGLHGSFLELSNAQATLAYAESYAAVKALADRYGPYRIRDLLESLGNRMEFAAAFEEAFMISYETFQSDWQRSIQEANR